MKYKSNLKKIANKKVRIGEGIFEKRTIVADFIRRNGGVHAGGIGQPKRSDSGRGQHRRTGPEI